MQQEKPNQKEFIKIHHERIEKYIPTKVKESGKVDLLFNVWKNTTKEKNFDKKEVLDNVCEHLKTK